MASAPPVEIDLEFGVVGSGGQLFIERAQRFVGSLFELLIVHREAARTSILAEKLESRPFPIGYEGFSDFGRGRRIC